MYIATASCVLGGLIQKLLMYNDITSLKDISDLKYYSLFKPLFRLMTSPNVKSYNNI